MRTGGRSSVTAEPPAIDQAANPSPPASLRPRVATVEVCPEIPLDLRCRAAASNS